MGRAVNRPTPFTMEVQFVKPFTDPGVRVYASGDVSEMPDATARNMIHHGIVIPVIRLQPQGVETAVRKRRKEARQDA